MSRTELLNEAIANRDAARVAYNTAPNRTDKGIAAERLEFWMGRVATLSQLGGWA